MNSKPHATSLQLLTGFLNYEWSYATLYGPVGGNYKIILNFHELQFGCHDRIDDYLVYSTFQKAGDTNHYMQLYITNRTAQALKRIE